LRRVALLVSVGIVLSGAISAAPTIAQGDATLLDPCIETTADPNEVPPPPPPPLEPLEPPGPGASEAEIEAYMESRAAAQEAAGGVDPNEVPPPPPDAPPPLEPDDEGPPCDVSYVPTASLGGASWSGACIDSLAKGPIVLKWKGPTQRGVFTLRPSSQSSGAITEVTNGSVPGATFTYKGKGRYRVEVTGTEGDGAPTTLDVVYQTKGTMKQCVSGSCITSKVNQGEALIPLDVQRHSCSGGS
jgi:hypothetical protein